jgi:hypothetical protein
MENKTSADVAADVPSVVKTTCWMSASLSCLVPPSFDLLRVITIVEIVLLCSHTCCQIAISQFIFQLMLPLSVQVVEASFFVNTGFDILPIFRYDQISLIYY